jgi:hypothetical protein
MSKVKKEGFIQLRVSDTQKAAIAGKAVTGDMNTTQYILHCAETLPKLDLELGNEAEALKALRQFWQWREKEALGSLKGIFSREELLSIVSRYNGTMLPPMFTMEVTPSVFAAEIEDGERYEVPCASYGANYDELITKVKNLTAEQCFFLRRAAYRAWYNGTHQADIEGFIKRLQ